MSDDNFPHDKLRSVFETLRELILENNHDLASRGVGAKDDFYHSDDWLRIRYAALKRSNGTCACCGQRGQLRNPLHVDHIKPRSKYPQLALDLSNLQVLCQDCDLGKSNHDETDWRS